MVATRAFLVLAVVMGVQAAMFSAGGAAVESGEDAASSNPCIVYGMDGNQLWIGDQGFDSKDLSSIIAAGVEDYPEEGTGVANCSHYEGVVVFKTEKSPHLDQIIAKAAMQYPSLVIESQIVPNSRSALLDYVNKLLKGSKVGDLVTGAAPNIYTGGLYAYTAADSSDQRVKHEVTTWANAQLDTDQVPITVKASGHATADVSRLSDVSPYTMGAKIQRSTGPGTYAICSLGIPIILSGTHMALTAGHCGSGTWASPAGGTVGTTYHNTWASGTASNYGDWQLVSGADYRKRVWATSTSYYTLQGARYTVMSVGDQLCSSGQTTGTICSYYVAVTDQTDYIDGVLVGHMTILTHQTVHGQYDNQGWRSGDSGGTIYYTSSSGDIVTGIVTGSGNSYTTYYYTQLNGVTAKYSGAAFGGHA